MIEVRPTSDETHDDEDICAAIAQRLAWNAAVSPHGIVPSVEQGCVTLTGMVDWHFERRIAEQDVRAVLGVTGVTNLITLKPRVDAADVGNDIRRALHRSWFFDGDPITVSVEGGNVTLTGTAASLHDRAVAERAAWSSSGTQGVQNEIRLA